VDDDHGHRIHERVYSPVMVLVAPRARGHQHHAWLPGGACVAVGHVGRALLVANPDQLDLRPDERVEERDGGAAGQAER